MSHNVPDFSGEKMLLDSLVAQWERQPSEAIAPPDVPVNPKRFPFNPNHAAKEELMQLGFSGTIASRIIYYRQRGGKFEIKNDLLKIYGIDTAVFRQLYVYIELPEKPYAHVHPKVVQAQHTAVKKINLNTADSLQLLYVRGIGPVLAQRIVKYRNRLGGFIRKEQLHEVYGLDSAAIAALSEIAFIDTTLSIRKININKATEEELSFHPYISRTASKAIVTYRFQHGPFQSEQDIGKIYALDEKTIQRIIPYLSVTD